jgi:hypothetical protein
VKLPRLLIADALAFHTLGEYSNQKAWGGVALPSPVPKSQGPGAPQLGVENSQGPAHPA